MKIKIGQTAVEEIANTITHGIGAMLGLLGLIVLVAKTAPMAGYGPVVASSIYCIALFLTYLSSTLYHSIPHKESKDVLLLLDYCAIFVLILATNLPFIVGVMPPEISWAVFTVLFIGTFIGVSLKIILYIRKIDNHYRLLFLSLYVIMGWFTFAWAGDALYDGLSSVGFNMMLTGGFLYTIGVIFYVWEKMPFNHAIWHILSLSGSICHYYVIICCVFK